MSLGDMYKAQFDEEDAARFKFLENWMMTKGEVSFDLANGGDETRFCLWNARGVLVDSAEDLRELIDRQAVRVSANRSETTNE